jgi:hypothetical protein
MSRSNFELVETRAGTFLNNCFTTELGFDTLSIYNTLHTRLDGGATWSNRTTATLSVTALQAMTNSYETLLNDRGLRMDLAPDKILIPPQLRFTAREILKTAKVPFSAENTVNSLLEEDLRFEVCHYLPSTTAWFVFPSNKELWPTFFWRERPSFASQDDFLSGDMLNKTFLRFSMGAAEPQGLFASTGV